MKNKFLIALGLLLPFVSCNLIEDATTVDIETTLKMDVPVAVVESTAMDLKSAADSYTFSKTGTLSLEDNSELEDYLSKIKSISIQSIDVDVLGLSSGQVIESLSVSVAGVGTIVELTNVSSTSGTLYPTISQAMLDEVGSKLKSDLQITATVNGTSNYAPMSFNLKLAMDAIVKAGAL